MNIVDERQLCMDVFSFNVSIVTARKLFPDATPCLIFFLFVNNIRKNNFYMLSVPFWCKVKNSVMIKFERGFNSFLMQSHSYYIITRLYNFKRLLFYCYFCFHFFFKICSDANFRVKIFWGKKRLI